MDNTNVVTGANNAVAYSSGNTVKNLMQTSVIVIMKMSQMMLQRELVTGKVILSL